MRGGRIRSLGITSSDTLGPEHGRSMEAEVRDIPTNAARRPHIGIGLLTGTRRSRDQILSLVSAEDSSETAPRSLASNAVLFWLLDLFC